MGGYFITNSNNIIWEEKIVNFFSQQDMIKYTKIFLKPFTLYYFHKINIANINHIYKNESDYIVGVGVFFYKDKFGYEALQRIYDNIQKNGLTNIFNDIQGHFNLIIYYKNELYIVTDKTGTYHSYYSLNDGTFFGSSSFYSILEILNNITVNKQELMEFIMFEAYIGENTPIKEVQFLKFGNIHHFNENNEYKLIPYFKEKLIDTHITINDIYDSIKKYFKIFNKLDNTITLDLSAGYDTRLVYAIFRNMNLNYILNTNENSSDSSDKKIPIEIAKKEKEKIMVYNKIPALNNSLELIKNSLIRNELIRDGFGGRYNYVFLSEKTKYFNVVIGGYGGELYRDVKYEGIKDIYDLISKQYIDKTFLLISSEKDILTYKKNLIKKLQKFLGKKNIKLNKIELEKIYYFIKMMYWGGSRITYFNRYGYRFHPLLDYELIYKLFYIENDEKADHKFMMKTIEKFDKSNNFIWEETIRSSYKNKRKLNLYKRSIINKLNNRYMQLIQKEESWRGLLQKDMIIKKYIGDKIDTFDMANKKLGRTFTVEYFLEKYANKIVA